MSREGGGVVRLTDRDPGMTGADMLAALVPPRQFAHATFAAYRADPEHPSQQRAKDVLVEFAQTRRPATRGGLFRRAKREPEAPPGVYLDGGFGVGKTHLLAALYHAMPARRKYFGSFIEYTALVGALGFARTVELFRGADLLCIDEFELDDPGDTMVMTRLISELVPTGTRLAATSNTPPDALGEGRFAAQDFLREIHAMAANFQTVRIDGSDFRHRDVGARALTLDADAYRAAIAGAAASGCASDDDFSDLVGHLAHVHPSRYLRLVEGLAAIGLREVVQITDQSAALRLVAFVDRAYDAQIPVRATGLALDEVFSAEMFAGGYRKKYLRALSRLVALTHS